MRRLREDEQGIAPQEGFNDEELDLSQDLALEQGQGEGEDIPSGEDAMQGMETEPSEPIAPPSPAPAPAPVDANGVQYVLVPVASLQAGQTITVPTTTGGITGGGEVGDEVIQGNNNISPQKESRRNRTFRQRQAKFREEFEEFEDTGIPSFGDVEEFEYEDGDVIEQDFSGEEDSLESTSSITIELPAGVDIPVGTEIIATVDGGIEDDEMDLGNEAFDDEYVDEDFDDNFENTEEGDLESMKVLEGRQSTRSRKYRATGPNDGSGPRGGTLAGRSSALRRKEAMKRRRRAMRDDVSKYQKADKVIVQDFTRYGDRADLVSKGTGSTARKKEYTPRIGKSWIVSDKQPKREAPKGLPGNDFSNRKGTPSKYRPKRTGAPKNFRDSRVRRPMNKRVVENKIVIKGKAIKESGKLDYKKLLSEGILG